MILIKKVGAITALALALSIPGAVAAETTTATVPLNTLTAREQAVIDFQTSMAAFRTAQVARQAAIRPLADARQAAVAAANTAFTTAIASVTTQEGRDALVKTRKDAIAAAHATFKAAVDALGAAPTKPAKPAKPGKAEKAQKLQRAATKPNHFPGWIGSSTHREIIDFSGAGESRYSFPLVIEYLVHLFPKA